MVMVIVSSDGITVVLSSEGVSTTSLSTSLSHSLYSADDISPPTDNEDGRRRQSDQIIVVIDDHRPCIFHPRRDHRSGEFLFLSWVTCWTSSSASTPS